MQLEPDKGCVATACDSGVKLSLEHVGEALRDIMDAFGYDVTEVQ